MVEARVMGDDLRHWKGKIFGPVSPSYDRSPFAIADSSVRAQYAVKGATTLPAIARERRATALTKFWRLASEV